jgi:SNF2 family DNA or RNA helicase
MDPGPRAHYDKMKKEMVDEISGQQITAPTAAALAGKLLQLTSGMVYDETGVAVEVHQTKIELLESIVEENPAPTMVFYHFKSAKKRLLETFPEAVELTEENIERWRRGEISMLIVHPQSGGIGLNLQCNAGDLAHVVWYDLPWSTENYIQANARVYRQGQTKPVMLHHLIMEKSIDEQVVEALEGRIDLQNALMETLKL